MFTKLFKRFFDYHPPINFSSNHNFLEDDEKTKKILELSEKLEAHEQKLSSIIENQQEMICRFDNTLRLTFVNHAIVNQPYCKSYGLTEEDLLGKSFLDFVPEEDHRVVLDDLSKLNRNNPTLLRDERLFDKNGNIIWQEWSNTAIFDENENIVEYQAVGRNITAKKILEQQLKKQTNLLNDILETQRDYVVRYTLDKKIVYANSEYCRIFYGGNSCIGEYARLELDKRLVHPNDLDVVRKCLENCLKEPYRDEMEYRVSIDGEYRWYHSKGIGVRDDDGNILEIQAVGRDITAKKILEQQIRSNNKLLNSILENTSDLIGRVNLDGYFTYVNPSFIDLIIDESCDISKIHFLDFIHPEDHDIALEVFAKVLKPPYQVDTYWRGLTKKGEFRWFHVEGTGILGDNGSSDCVVEIQAVGRDFTDQKLWEENLIEEDLIKKYENDILLMISNRDHLQKILDKICIFAEDLDNTIKTSILFFDEDKKSLFHAAGLSLNDEYNKLLMPPGLPIGPNVGSCGTAAYLKKLVIVEDIKNDPKWTPYNEFIRLNDKYHLNSCWSKPILSENNRLLGTIANYSSRIGPPTEKNLRILEWSSHIASIAIEQDTRERKLIESNRNLKEAEKKYRLLINKSQTIIYTISLDGFITFISPSIKTVLNFEPSEIIGKSYIDLIHTDDVHQCLTFLSDENFIKNDVEYRTFDKSGKTHYHRAVITPVFNEEGFKTHYIGNSIDITDRYEKELQIVQKNRLLDNILRSHKDYVVRYKTDKTITYANDVYKNTFFNGQDCVGMMVTRDLVYPDDRDTVSNYLKTVSEPPYEAEMEYRMLTSDGSYRWYHASATGIFDENYNLIEIQSVGRDLTNRKILEQQIYHQNQLLNNILEMQTDCIVRCSLDRQVLYANKAYARTFCGVEEVTMCLQIDFMGNVHPDDRDLVEECMKDLINTPPHELSVEYRVVDFDQNNRFFRWQANGILDENGKVIEIQGVGRDIDDYITWKNLTRSQLRLLCLKKY